MKSSIWCALALLGAVAAPTAMAAGGDKPVLGGSEVRNETSAGWWSGSVGWELAGMLSNELSSSGYFRIVERSKLQPVLEEQNMAAAGRTASGTGAKIGKLTGAQYLVFG